MDPQHDGPAICVRKCGIGLVNGFRDPGLRLLALQIDLLTLQEEVEYFFFCFHFEAPSTSGMDNKIFHNSRMSCCSYVIHIITQYVMT